MLQLIQLVPNFSLKDRFGRDRKAIATDKVCLALIAEIRIVLQESLEAIFTWFEFAVLVFEHADGAASVDDEDLSGEVFTSYRERGYLR